MKKDQEFIKKKLNSFIKKILNVSFKNLSRHLLPIVAIGHPKNNCLPDHVKSIWSIKCNNEIHS